MRALIAVLALCVHGGHCVAQPSGPRAGIPTLIVPELETIQYVRPIDGGLVIVGIGGVVRIDAAGAFTSRAKLPRAAGSGRAILADLSGDPRPEIVRYSSAPSLGTAELSAYTLEGEELWQVRPRFPHERSYGGGQIVAAVPMAMQNGPLSIVLLGRDNDIALRYSSDGKLEEEAPEIGRFNQLAVLPQAPDGRSELIYADAGLITKLGTDGKPIWKAQLPGDPARLYVSMLQEVRPAETGARRFWIMVSSTRGPLRDHDTTCFLLTDHGDHAMIVDAADRPLPAGTTVTAAGESYECTLEWVREEEQSALMLVITPTDGPGRRIRLCGQREYGASHQVFDDRAIAEFEHPDGTPMLAVGAGHAVWLIPKITLISPDR